MFILSCTVLVLTVCGFKRDFTVGTIDLNRRDMSSCDGEYPHSRGQFRYSRKARYGSLLSDFALRISRLAVCTVFSARPLDRGYRGLEVLCSKPHSLANILNCSDVN